MLFVSTLLTAVTIAPALAPAPAALAWPVRGPLLRAYDGGTSPYTAGHRGIDIGAPVGTPIRSAGPGTVAFAGKVAGSLYVSVDHPGGLRTTYSWLSSTAVRTGDRVETGTVLGTTGSGHPGSVVSHLHLGVRLDGSYVDPLDYLPGLDLSDLLRLAPIRGP